MMFPMDYKTMALLAIVTGLVIICMGLWYVWNTQQVLGTEVRYLRNQHISLQEQLKKQTIDVAKPSSVQQLDTEVQCSYTPADGTTVSTTHSQKDSEGTTLDANDVLHRSYQMIDSATDVSKNLSTSAHTQESSSSADDDDTDDSVDDDGEYDDDDQNVETSDIVHPLHGATKSDAQPANTNEDTNHLVESILSNIVSETVDSHHEQSKQDEVDDTIPTTEETNDENFLENSGNYTALAESLRKKTVVELKKMCAEYQIGVKKGKTFLKKEELIEELVVKMPHA